MKGGSPTPQPAGIVDNIGIVDVLKYSDADMERIRAEIRKEMEGKVELEKKDLMQQVKLQRIIPSRLEIAVFGQISCENDETWSKTG